MNLHKGNAESINDSFRFELRSHFAAVAVAAVVCTLLFVLLPEIWTLIMELRWVPRVFVSVLAMAGVFVLIVIVGVALRLSVLAVTGSPAEQLDRSKVE